jgi:FixJ family two-component response regulator
MAGRGRTRRPNVDPVADELESIKRLMVLQLITSGVQAKDIAAALDVDQECDKPARSRVAYRGTLFKTFKINIYMPLGL